MATTDLDRLTMRQCCEVGLSCVSTACWMCRVNVDASESRDEEETWSKSGRLTHRRHKQHANRTWSRPRPPGFRTNQFAQADSVQRFLDTRTTSTPPVPGPLFSSAKSLSHGSRPFYCLLRFWFPFSVLLGQYERYKWENRLPPNVFRATTIRIRVPGLRCVYAAWKVIH